MGGRGGGGRVGRGRAEGGEGEDGRRKSGGKSGGGRVEKEREVVGRGIIMANFHGNRCLCPSFSKASRTDGRTTRMIV